MKLAEHRHDAQLADQRRREQDVGAVRVLGVDLDRDPVLEAVDVLEPAEHLSMIRSCATTQARGMLGVTVALPDGIRVPSAASLKRGKSANSRDRIRR